MKRILFVDDEPRVLDGLRRMLYPLRNEWHTTFVSSAKEALRVLSETECDLIVTDLRMPGMSGLDLLAEVVNRYPHVVRIVLSGTADHDSTLRSATLAHQCLLKPCDTAMLRATVERAFSVRGMLENPSLKQLVSGLRSIPTLPASYLNLVEVLRSPDATPKQVGEIVSKDIGMTAKILHLVNSAFFGVRRQISNPIEAAVYLGVDTIKALVLTVSVFSQFDRRAASAFSIEALRDHSIEVANLARGIGKSLNWSPRAIDDTFTGGILHDIGKLLLAGNYPKEYEEVLSHANDATRFREAEQKIFGTTHAEAGAYLLWLWGLPDPVTESVALHHNLPPGVEQEMRPVVAVHVADALVHNRPEDIDSKCFGAADLVRGVPNWAGLRDDLREGR